MFTINNYDYECTKKCRNPDHGKIINDAITKRSIDNDQLAAFIAKSCRNFSGVVDYEGRTALHLAASIGKYLIAEWLINHGAIINKKDDENGHTPLHRAIYYGNIDVAVLLLRYGAQMDILDSDSRNPLQHRANHVVKNSRYSTDEFLVWGNNKNFHLGIGNEQGNYWPQLVDSFRKNNITIREASISTYHSLFLSNERDLYAVGHGKNGRLGTGAEHTLVEPKVIKLPSKSLAALKLSAGKYHSLILTENNEILSTGLNNYNQLGIKPAPDKVLQFTPISCTSEINVKFNGVKAHDTYSLAFNDSSIYIWGTNNGQFGLSKEILNIPTIQQLNTIKTDQSIVFDSSESAIVYFTPNKIIHILHKHKFRSNKSPNLENVIKLRIVGLESTTEKDNSGIEDNILKILILAESGVYIWYDDLQKYVRCTFPLARYIKIDNIKKCGNRFLVLSEGDLYMASPKRVNVKQIELSEYKNTFNSNIDGSFKVRTDMKKLPNLSRIVWFTVDPNGENFAVRQKSSRDGIEFMRLVKKVLNLEKFFEETSEDDAVHDIVIHVDGRKFPAHRFILCNRAPKLSKLIKASKEKDFHLVRDHLTAPVFQVILKYIYTGKIIPMDDIIDLYDGLLDKRDSLKAFSAILDNFGILDYTMGKHFTESKYPSFDRNGFKELYDIVIKCENNQEIYAHKCILVARLQYFEMMFSHRWSESDTVNLTTIPVKYMLPIIDYLYTFNFMKFTEEYHSDAFLFTLMTVCDQFFADQMKHNLEVLVLDRLTIKNCGEILEFACAFHCENLEKFCLEYICYNIERVLENHALDCLEVDVLVKVTEMYKNLFENVSYRMITPYSDAVDDVTLESYVSDFKVDLDYKMVVSESGNKPKKVKQKVNKNVLERRQLERNAIVLIKDLSIEDKNTQAEDVKNKVASGVLNEARIVSEKIQSKAQSWVNVKKDVKKKSVPGSGVNTNNILRTEEKPPNKLINLNTALKSDLIKSKQEDTKTATIDKTLQNCVQSPPKEPEVDVNRSFFCLSDITPIKTGKLSQKQRKKLSLEAANSPPTKSPAQLQFDITPNKSTPTTPITINSPPTPNAWGIQSPIAYNSDSPISDGFKKRTNSESNQTSTHAKSQPMDIISRKQKTSESQNSYTAAGLSCSPSGSSSFFAIQENERLQRENYEKMKSKPLHLTQIEEQAIEELKKFYNVENCYDEYITIERKNLLQGNFATWDHHK